MARKKQPTTCELERLDQNRKAASNLTDFDGDGTPGGSLSDLAWQLAQVGWEACDTWASLRCNYVAGGFAEPWSILGDNDRLLIAIEADRCINEPGYTPHFPGDGTWEAEVRGKLFAAVVRSIAL